VAFRIDGQNKPFQQAEESVNTSIPEWHQGLL
jgi:hypothetical protein